MALKLKIQQIAYHRNGVSGNGFHVITFKDGRDRRLAIVFADRGNVAVFDRALLADDVIDSAVNSWRGDYYEVALRQAIADDDYDRHTADIVALDAEASHGK